MAQNYSYPRVTISTTALKHANLQPVAVDTTILFVPMVTEKGPTDVVYPVHSLAEFVEVFGELDYHRYGLVALNVANWLTNGGTVYLYRLTEAGYASGESKEPSLSVKAKYRGEFYNGINVSIEKAANKASTTIKVSKSNKELESFTCSYEAIKKVLKNSQYIEPFELDVTKATAVSANCQLGGAGTELSSGTVDNMHLVLKFWSGDLKVNGQNANNIIANRLEVPVDLVMDAGYDLATKKAMINFITGDSAVRPDIVGIFECFNGCPTVLEYSDFETKASNIALYDQLFVIEYNDEDIKVGPSYFLSQLLPYNDNMYGIQWPTAGVRRAVLEGVKKINMNPTPAKMEELFVNRVNYVQKSSREYAFMSQRTYDGSSDDSFTALSFLNNTRVLHKIRNELERIAREYLFQFNDAVTIANMNEVLNKYMASWVANRTLASASVVASKNPYSDEAVDVNLTMRFTSTIEVISIDITVE